MIGFGAGALRVVGTVIGEISLRAAACCDKPDFERGLERE